MEQKLYDAYQYYVGKRLPPSIGIYKALYLSGALRSCHLAPESCICCWAHTLENTTCVTAWFAWRKLIKLCSQILNVIYLPSTRCNSYVCSPFMMPFFAKKKLARTEEKYSNGKLRSSNSPIIPTQDRVAGPASRRSLEKDEGEKEVAARGWPNEVENLLSCAALLSSAGRRLRSGPRSKKPLPPPRNTRKKKNAPIMAIGTIIGLISILN